MPTVAFNNAVSLLATLSCLVNFYDSSAMQLRPIMNAKVSSHDTVYGLDNGSVYFADV